MISYARTATRTRPTTIQPGCSGLTWARTRGGCWRTSPRAEIAEIAYGTGITLYALQGADRGTALLRFNSTLLTLAQAREMAAWPGLPLHPVARTAKQGSKRSREQSRKQSSK